MLLSYEKPHKPVNVKALSRWFNILFNSVNIATYIFKGMLYTRIQSDSKESHKTDDIGTIFAARIWSNASWSNVNRPLNIGFSSE